MIWLLFMITSKPTINLCVYYYVSRPGGFNTVN